MGQASLRGPGGAAALEALVPGDMIGLQPGRQKYTLLMTDQGTILDDLMVANIGEDHLFLVVNASRKHIDLPHIAAHLPKGVTLEPHADRALLALQGPEAVTVLSRFAPGVAAMPFMGFITAPLLGAVCHISRSGYTGEDVYEISIPADRATDIARALLGEPEVMPIGLGARDSLRLEAGLCLYGNDIDETTTPVEAALMWVMSKRRKTDWDFLGANKVRAMLEAGPPRKRVGIQPEGRAPARSHTEILAPDGTPAGEITSGGFGPSCNAPVAMGYVRADLAAPGTAVSLMVRGKPMPARVVALPFVPHRYVR
jgi:aminomethyltransferase